MATETKRVYDIQVNGTESFNELKKAIEQLNEKLKTLNQTSQEYKDTLKQLAELQSQLAETMTTAKDVLDAFGETGSDVVESFLTGFVEGMQEAASATTEVNTSTIELDDSLTKEASSLKELKEQINGLKDRLVQLNVNSKEYKETVELLVDKNQKLQRVLNATKSEVSGVTGSYNALSQEMAALRKRWKETSDEAERAQIGKRIAEINTELKKMDASIGNYQRNVGNYAGAMKDVFGNPREQIRKLRQELATLEVGSKRYNEVLMEMADWTQKQKHFNDQLAFSSANLEDILKNMAGVAAGVVGGFSALNAAMGLFGDQNEDVQKAMLKTQQMIALVQGLNGLAGLKDKIVGLFDGIKGFSSRFGLLNKSTSQFTSETEAAAGASQDVTATLTSQAGVTTELAEETDKASIAISDNAEITKQQAAASKEQQKETENTIRSLEKEMDVLIMRASILRRQHQDREALDIEKEISNIRERIKETEKEALETEKTTEAKKEEVVITDELISKLQEELVEIEDIKKAKDGIISVSKKEIEAKKQEVKTLEEEISSLEKELKEKRKSNDATREEIKLIREKISEKKEALNTAEKELATKEKTLSKTEKENSRISENITQKNMLLQKEKQLNAELQKKDHLSAGEQARLLSELNYTKALIKMEDKRTAAIIASTNAKRLDVIQLKAQAWGWGAVSVAAKGATVAVKGAKAAIVSTGLGAILILLTSQLAKLGEFFSTQWRNMRGITQLTNQLKQMNYEVEAIYKNMTFMEKVWRALGETDFGIAIHQIYNYKAAVEEADRAWRLAVKNSKVGSEEIQKAYETLQDAQGKLNSVFEETFPKIEQMMYEVELAQAQSGMTQLEIDLQEVNLKYEQSIKLIKLWGDQGKFSAEQVSEYIQRLNKDLAIQRQMLIDAANSAATATTATTATTKPAGKSEYEKQKEEAEKLYKDLIEANKREEQKLKEKYEKEKKLLEKFHKDTTLLTKKYYEDLDKLLTERQKIEYDKWVAHLNALLGLEEKNSIRFYEQEIETMKKIFSADFGADNESPFEQLFNIQILDEWGSKAISITDDIAESMKMMGLDPTNIDDIQTMIDKWAADKKAIEDAEKALKKLKSEMKFDELQGEADAIEGYLDAMLNTIDARYQVLETETARFFGKESGFYTGLSPAEMQEQFEERYQIIEQEIQRELDLWKNAMEDESLSAEERNRAIQKYNQTMVKQNTYAVQKEIDANNLLIKSFERVSNAISSMSTNLANILGTVSDMIMDTANRQYEANEITAEAYEEQFNKAKGIQIAQATINTIAGAVGAFMGITRDTGGWGIAAAAIEAAAVLAAGFAQIALIRNTKPDTSSGGGGGSESTTFQLPSVMVPEPTRVQNTTNQSDIDALANALGDQRVILVESDVTNAQKKTKKVDVESTF